MRDITKVTDVGKLPARDSSGHKGSYGHVLVVGGSRGMVGAVAMACNSAFRGGSGLVTFAAPEPVQLAIAPMTMCATSLPLACDEAGELAPESLRQVHDELARCDVLAIGPGMGVGPRQQQLVRWALEQPKPAIIDADGLNNLARIDGWPSLRRCPLVLTPHPGELSRLTGRAVKDIQSSRPEVAIETARGWLAPADTDNRLVLVLKGAGTIVTDGEKVYQNTTGNPGMASGGSGDILTGLAAALLGQGMEPFDAATAAVYAHGLAGDLAADKLGQVSLMASDLLDYLPAAMRGVSG
jgi:NAD(P)H-hydrate epimerase